MILIRLISKFMASQIWKKQIHLFFYNEPVYKQVALGRQIAKQLSA